MIKVKSHKLIRSAFAGKRFRRGDNATTAKIFPDKLLLLLY